MADDETISYYRQLNQVIESNVLDDSWLNPLLFWIGLLVTYVRKLTSLFVT